jgi:predicted O-linked N-acetylglucosamine transferase (SPINDLY family)
MVANDGLAWRGVAQALEMTGAPTSERVTAWGRAAQFHGAAIDHTRHGLALVAAGDYSAAHAAFGRALAREPDDLPAAWAAMQYPPEPIHANDDAVDAFRAGWDADFARLGVRLDAVPPDVALATVSSASNFFRHYVDEDVLGVQRRYAALLGRVVARAVPDSTGPQSPARHGRIRVALFSAHFFDHTILRLFGPMLSALERARFHVHAFSAGLHDHAGRAFAERIEGHTHAALPVAGWAQKIRDFAPDVLLYPDIGMDAVSQCLSTLRLAPVQAVLWGHPITTGSSAIDWFLTPGSMEPDDAESHYSERLWRLPGVGCCFEAPTGTTETPPELAQRDPARVEVGFVQSFAKNLPRHDRLLARTAKAAPAVRFHLTPANNPRISDQVRARTEAAFAAAGLDPARHLGIVRGLPRPQFLALGQALDFAVDSLGWSGGNTTLELLWGGLPVITCPGRTMRTRHTKAMLELLELPELIAHDEDTLVALAVRLAGSADLRADLRGRIEGRKHRLFDDLSVISALEGFLENSRAQAHTAGLAHAPPRQ